MRFRGIRTAKLGCLHRIDNVTYFACTFTFAIELLVPAICYAFVLYLCSILRISKVNCNAIRKEKRNGCTCSHEKYIPGVSASTFKMFESFSVANSTIIVPELVYSKTGTLLSQKN